jgi:hypothetical protein
LSPVFSVPASQLRADLLADRFEGALGLDRGKGGLSAVELGMTDTLKPEMA